MRDLSSTESSPWRDACLERTPSRCTSFREMSLACFLDELAQEASTLKSRSRNAKVRKENIGFPELVFHPVSVDQIAGSKQRNGKGPNEAIHLSRIFANGLVCDARDSTQNSVQPRRRVIRKIQARVQHLQCIEFKSGMVDRPDESSTTRVGYCYSQC